MLQYVVSEGVVIVKGVRYPGSYSGHGPGLNNPADDKQVDVGPLPSPGQYQIGEWHDDPKLGPCIAHLTPLNIETDRSGFYWHGDNKFLNHSGSDGCLVSPHDIRVIAKQSGETILDVVP
jgi:hypothetical protein